MLPHLKELGLDPTPYTAQVDWLFEKLLGDRTLPPGRARQWWLMERVATIAAIEHYTAFLGNWVLNAEALDRRGADPTMLDLLRWHGAEEVEHRSVAFELFSMSTAATGAGCAPGRPRSPRSSSCGSAAPASSWRTIRRWGRPASFGPSTGAASGACCPRPAPCSSPSRGI